MPEAVEALRLHKTRQNEERLRLGSKWEDSGLVFPTTTGTLASRSNLAARMYDLRHTFGTLWVEWGENHKILQGILGHARISTTLDRYVHPSEKAHREAMGRFGERLRKGP